MNPLKRIQLSINLQTVQSRTIVCLILRTQSWSVGSFILVRCQSVRILALYNSNISMLDKVSHCAFLEIGHNIYFEDEGGEYSIIQVLTCTSMGNLFMFAVLLNHSANLDLCPHFQMRNLERGRLHIHFELVPFFCRASCQALAAAGTSFWQTLLKAFLGMLSPT